MIDVYANPDKFSDTISRMQSSQDAIVHLDEVANVYISGPLLNFIEDNDQYLHVVQDNHVAIFDNRR